MGLECPLASSIKSTASGGGIGLECPLASSVRSTASGGGAGVRGAHRPQPSSSRLPAGAQSSRLTSSPKLAASGDYLAAAVESLSAIRLSQRKCATTPDQNVLCSA
jgi:hypothetical protein